MTRVGILLLINGVWVAFTMVGSLIKVLLWGAILVGLYWLAAPFLGMPRPF
jgi:hypothetical protein